MSNTNFLERGIEMAQKAVEADHAAKYKDALQLYCQSIELLMLAIKWERSKDTKEKVRAKTEEYLARAEEIKNALGEKEKKGKSSEVGSNGKAADKGEDEQDAESKKRRGALQSAALTEKPNVRWEDVAGLESAKATLKEAVILPMKFPHLFQGKRKPWTGILLYGPPGTGKSYLAKAVATEAKSTFYSLSSSDLVSKWMGESEKLIKELFTTARENKPAVIFIDEIDALCGPRGEGESEASHRIKTEFMIQTEGVGKDSTGVLLLAATNLPWQLDSAIRRRFQRRVHIGLPDLPGRIRMFEVSVGTTPCQLTQADYRRLGEMTDGYSGSDIKNAVQDALMEPIRKIQAATHYKEVRTDEGAVKWTPCSPGDAGAREMDWMELEGEQLLEPALTVKDFLRAVKSSRPTVSKEDIGKAQEWTEQFGMEG